MRLDIAVACLLITVAVVAIPALHAVYPSPTARAAVQTTSLLGGLLLAYLLFGRFGRTGRLDDLLLANALSIGVCGNFVLLVLLVGNLQAHGLSAWAPALAQLVSGAGTAVAAFAPARELTVDRASAARRSALIAASATGLLVVMIVALPGLDWPAAAGVAHPVSLRLFSGPAGVLAVQGFLALASALAAVGFSRKADMEGDEFANLLGLSFALGAFARVNYLLTPSLYTPFV